MRLFLVSIRKYLLEVFIAVFCSFSVTTAYADNSVEEKTNIEKPQLQEEKTTINNENLELEALKDEDSKAVEEALGKETAVENEEETNDEALQQEADALPETLPPFTLTQEEAQNKLGLTDGIRDFDDSTINTLPASTLFSTYQMKPLFSESDFINNKLQTPREVTLTWKNSNNKNWQPNDNESLCNTKATGDFELTMTAKFDEEVELVKKYIIPSKNGICYIKPLSLSVVGNDKNYSSDFDPLKGFSASAKVKFPTTGFESAVFEVALKEGVANNYTLRSNYQDKGLLINRYSDKTIIKIKEFIRDTIIIELVSGDKVIDSYAFTLKNWFVNAQDRFYQWEKISNIATNVEDFCEKQPNRFRVATAKEMTNSNFVKGYIKTSGTSSGNYYRRAIGEGLLPEWGTLNQYDSAYWYGGYYWLLQPSGAKSQSVVFLEKGELVVLRNISTNFVVCINRK